MKILFIKTAVLGLLIVPACACAQSKQFDPASVEESDLILPTTNYYYTWIEQRKRDSTTSYYIAITTSANPVSVLLWHFRYAKGIVFLADAINYWDSPIGTIVCTNPSKTAKEVCKRAKREYGEITANFKKCDREGLKKNVEHCARMHKQYTYRFPRVEVLEKVGFTQVEPKP